MTNKEYIEKNNISFSEAMKMWDNQTNHIEDWLNKTHSEWKFKPGDILAFCDTPSSHFRNDHIFIVIDRDDNYLYVKDCDRNGNFQKWSSLRIKDSKYFDDHFVKIIKYFEQDYFKKIF